MEITKGDPIVVDGHKYRVRGGGVDLGYLAIALAPARNPTHSVHFDVPPVWDGRAGVWRVNGRLGIHPSRLP
ncbi:MAG: hypothetical protein AB7I04_18355 [Pseudomonadales bacterium]